MVKDTHRAMSRPIILSARLNVTKRAGGRLHGLMIDGDIPGHSDNGKSGPIRPELKLELSHGLTSTYGARKARMYWLIEKHSSALLKTKSFRAEEPMYIEGFKWRPSDDLDIEVLEEKKLYKGLARVIKARKWKTPADASMWFATDTEVLLILLMVQLGPQAVKKAEEICDNYTDDDGDGKPDCLDSDCKEDKFSSETTTSEHQNGSHLRRKAPPYRRVQLSQPLRAISVAAKLRARI